MSDVKKGQTRFRVPVTIYRDAAVYIDAKDREEAIKKARELTVSEAQVSSVDGYVTLRVYPEHLGVEHPMRGERDE
jgi:hypothetical protein